MSHPRTNKKIKGHLEPEKFLKIIGKTDQMCQHTHVPNHACTNKSRHTYVHTQHAPIAKP